MAEMVTEARLTTEMRQAVDAAWACARTCQETFGYCLEMGGLQAAPSHLRVLLDCAETCVSAGATLLRGAVNGPLWAACLAACECCEASCRAHPEDRQMQVCAGACRKSVAACQPLATGKT